MKKRFFHFPVIFTAIALLLATACKKEEPATKPSLSTTPVTSITTTTATSGGEIDDDGGAPVTANGVCWGKTENPVIEGSKTSESVSTGQFVSNLTGLDAGTNYHVRAYATNAVGTSYGDDVTFLTLGQAPSGVTQTPSSITAAGATLIGTVNPNDLSTTVTFEYGTTTGYGSTAPASQSPVTGNTMVEVSAQISGLLPATTYHYRVKTVNSLGTTYGEDKTFTTLGQAPTATTQAACCLSSTGATLNGTVNANYVSTTVTFEYGTTTNYGQTVTASQSPVTGTTNVNVSAGITGLTAGTTYHFRVKAVNSVGTTYGDDKSFTTPYSPPPTNGLVGYWPFTGNANDASGNNHHGTVNGASLTTERFGAANGAYSFDGVNDYIAIAPSSLVDNETAATLSFWLKRGVDDDYGLPIHTGNQGRIQTSVSKNSVSVGVTTNSNYDGSAPSEFGVTYEFIQTQWNHIILRYDGTSKTLQIFLNGELKKETFAEGNIWAAQGCYLAFGVYYLFGSPHHGYYKGILDDVRLYKRALSYSEIQSLYHENGW